MVSDNGLPFSNWNFYSWCKKQGIRILHSPAYHLQSNGTAARAVQDIKYLLKRKLMNTPLAKSKINEFTLDIIKQIQADIRFEKSLLQGKPGEMIYSFSINCKFNKLLFWV